MGHEPEEAETAREEDGVKRLKRFGTFFARCFSLPGGGVGKRAGELVASREKWGAQMSRMSRNVALFWV
jgi:hypothetical protein